jgi:hypothetical protein
MAPLQPSQLLLPASQFLPSLIAFDCPERMESRHPVMGLLALILIKCAN